jgi:hypothetical protein
VDGADRLLGAELAVAVGMARAVQRAGAGHRRHRFGVVALLGQFAEAAGALALDFGGREGRMLDHVGQHVQRLREVRAQRQQRHVDASVLLPVSRKAPSCAIFVGDRGALRVAVPSSASAR